MLLRVYAKLFTKIVDSSIMEEPLETRYVFVMLIAVADRHGQCLGTDTALARRLNMPLADFERALVPLLSPDARSNSKEHEGRRLIRNEGETGYQIVNYVAYHRIRNEEHRREYMRDYMAKRRKRGDREREEIAGAEAAQGVLIREERERA